MGTHSKALIQCSCTANKIFEYNELSSFQKHDNYSLSWLWLVYCYIFWALILYYGYQHVGLCSFVDQTHCN